MAITSFLFWKSISILHRAQTPIPGQVSEGDACNGGGSSSPVSEAHKKMEYILAMMKLPEHLVEEENMSKCSANSANSPPWPVTHQKQSFSNYL